MKHWTVIMMLAACGLAGCTTMYGQREMEADARLEMEVRTLRGQIEQLQERVELMDIGRQDLYNRIEQVGANQQAAQREQEARLAKIEQGLSAQEVARTRDREEIVSTLSRQVSELVTPARSASGGDGYEHTVKTGETLSAIAAAYGVKTSVIAEANNIRDPNTIRVGQKLFIPQ
jgi:LysM repeat protein